MDSITVSLTEEESLLVERHYFELNGHKIRLIQFACETRFPIKDSTFNDCLEKYLEAFTVYNILVTYLIHLHCDKPVLFSKYRIDINFEEQVIRIVSEENQTCNVSCKNC